MVYSRNHLRSLLNICSRRGLSENLLAGMGRASTWEQILPRDAKK